MLGLIKGCKRMIPTWVLGPPSGLNKLERSGNDKLVKKKKHTIFLLTLIMFVSDFSQSLLFPVKYMLVLALMVSKTCSNET